MPNQRRNSERRLPHHPNYKRTRTLGRVHPRQRLRLVRACPRLLLPIRNEGKPNHGHSATPCHNHPYHHFLPHRLPNRTPNDAIRCRRRLLAALGWGAKPASNLGRTMPPVRRLLVRRIHLRECGYENRSILHPVVVVLQCHPNYQHPPL